MSTDVIRRLHKLAPFLRWEPESMIVIGIFHQLTVSPIFKKQRASTVTPYSGGQETSAIVPAFTVPPGVAVRGEFACTTAGVHED
jgi:hypothetical protein